MASAGAPVVASVMVMGLTDGAVPMFVMVAVHSTEPGPLMAQLLLTLKSGAWAGATVTDAQMFVLLEGLESANFGLVFACVTVAQLVNEPPFPNPNPKKMNFDSPGASEVLEVHVFGWMDPPGPGEQLAVAGLARGHPAHEGVARPGRDVRRERVRVGLLQRGHRPQRELIGAEARGRELRRQAREHRRILPADLQVDLQR